MLNQPPIVYKTLTVICIGGGKNETKREPMERRCPRIDFRVVEPCPGGTRRWNLDMLFETYFLQRILRC